MKKNILLKLWMVLALIATSWSWQEQASAAAPTEPVWAFPENGSSVPMSGEIRFTAGMDSDGNKMHMLVAIEDQKGTKLTFTTDDQMRVSGNPVRSLFKANGSLFPTEGVSGGESIAFLLPTLMNGAVYKFSIGVFEPTENHVVWSKDVRSIQVVNVPDKPNRPILTVLSETNIKMELQAFQNVTYTVYDNGAEIRKEKQGTLLVNGLAPNSLHRITYTVSNDVGTSPLSDSATIYTLAQQPNQPSASIITNQSVFLNLSSNNPLGTLRKLQRSTDLQSWSTIKEQVDLLAFEDMNLTANTDYFYRVIDVNGDGIPSSPSHVLQVRTVASGLSIPKLTVLSSNSIRAEMKSVAGAQTYHLFINGVEEYSGNSQVYDKTNLTPNQEVRVAYAVTNASGKSPLSGEAKAYTFAVKPINLQAQVTGNSAKVSWEHGANPTYTEYLLNINGYDNGWWKAETLTTITNLPLGVNKLKVKARNKDGIETGYTNEVSVVVYEAGNGTAPSNISPSYDTVSKKLTVRFTGVPGVSEYIVSVKQNGRTVATRTTTKDFVEFQEFSGGEVLVIEVLAKGGASASTSFNVPTVVSPLGNLHADDIEKDGFVIRFNNPQKLQVKLELWEGTSKLATKSTRKESYQFNKLKENTTYSIIGYFSKTPTEQTLLQVTTSANTGELQMLPVRNLHVSKKTSKKVSVSWDAPDNAKSSTYYVIKRKQKTSEKYDFTLKTTSLSYGDSRIEEDQVYVYEVIAGDSGKLESIPVSIEVSTSMESDLPELEPLTDLEAKVANKRLTLRWDGDCETYTVERTKESGQKFISKKMKRTSFVEKTPEDGIWIYTVYGSSKGYKDTPPLTLKVKISKGELKILD